MSGLSAYVESPMAARAAYVESPVASTTLSRMLVTPGSRTAGRGPMLVA